MLNPLKRFPDPLARILVLFLILVGVFVSVRIAVPSSIKNASLGVRLTMEREAAHPVRFASSAPCADCHEEYKVKQAGYHKTLSCETCHGAAKAHVENPTEVKPVAPRKREFCAVCHHFDFSRPTGFPQINPVAHNPMKPCITCHNPHDPRPPTPPQECQACHGEIARTKSVSPHALLDCTTCHNVPAEHKVQPRVTQASIPSEREFCGKCHAKQSTYAGTPKVDIAAHGEKYLCWQCHYPHMPEVR